MEKKKVKRKPADKSRSTTERRRSNDGMKTTRKPGDAEVDVVKDERTARKSDRNRTRSEETRQKDRLKSTDGSTKRSSSRVKNSTEVKKRSDEKTSKDDSQRKMKETSNGRSKNIEKTTSTRRESVTSRTVVPRKEEAKKSSEKISNVRNVISKDTKSGHTTERDSKRNNNNSDYDYEDDFEDYESDFEEDEISDNDDNDGDNDGNDKYSEDNIVSSLDHKVEIDKQRLLLDDKELGRDDFKHKNNLERDDFEHKNNLERNDFEHKNNLERDDFEHKNNLELRENINVDLSNEEIINEDEEILEKKASVDLTSKNVGRDPELSERKKEKPMYVEHLNFDVAKKLSVKQQKLSKTRMRGEKLLDLITLDAVTFSLFSLQPRTYDDFMTNFGNTNSIQAYVQTGDDDIPEETQTDSIVVQEVWTQHPPSHEGAIGGELSTEQSKKLDIDIDSNIKNWKHFSQFLQKSSQVLCTLLEEEYSSARDERVPTVQKGTSFSDKTLLIQPPNFIRDSAVSFTATSKLQPNLILSIYRRNTKDTLQTEENHILSHKNIICVWNIHQPMRPQKVLISSSEALCCCFSQSAEFVFAGLVDGSIAVWDLRETESLHQRLKEDNIILRAPTYNTAGFTGHEGHRSAVVAILCRTSNDSSMIPTNKPLGMVSGSGGITQLATLEEEAVLCIWVVTETLHQDMSGDDNDLGLAPGGRVQLVKSLTIELQDLPNLQKHLYSNIQVTDFTCHHQDMNRFYITTDMGFVIMCPVHDRKIKMYSPAEDVASTAKAVSIRLSNHGEPQCFLVGCSDGSVRLHSIAKEKPLMVWTAAAKGEAVQRVGWSESCPNIFYVLDTSGQIHLWDLCQSDCEPVSSTTISNRRIKHFDVSCDKRVSNEANSRNKPYVVLGCDNGTLEIHYLNKQYSRHGFQEKEMYRKYVELL